MIDTLTSLIIKHNEYVISNEDYKLVNDNRITILTLSQMYKIPLKFKDGLFEIGGY